MSKVFFYGSLMMHIKSNLWALLAGVALLWLAGTGGLDCLQTRHITLPWTGVGRSPHAVSPGSSTRELEAPSARHIADQMVTDSSWLVLVSPSLDWDSHPQIGGGKLGHLSTEI